MPNHGPNVAGSATQTTSGGIAENNWGGTGNTTSLNGVFASAVPWYSADAGGAPDLVSPVQVIKTRSPYLILTNFGFAIPAGEIPSAVIVDFDRADEADKAVGSAIKDYAVQLVFGGSIVGNNKADLVTLWPSVVTNKQYSYSVAEWNVAGQPRSAYNLTTFGVAIAVQGDGGPFSLPYMDFDATSAFIDRLRLSVQTIIPAPIEAFRGSFSAGNSFASLRG